MYLKTPYLCPRPVPTCRNEDFYAMIDAGTVPEYDVLITNPPYSEDHMERLLKFCVTRPQPWFLLIPNYVCTKPYYQPVLASDSEAPSKPFYVFPKKRYCYWAPKGVSRDNPNVRKDGRTSPFVTFWCAPVSIDDGFWQQSMVIKIHFHNAFHELWRCICSDGVRGVQGPVRPTPGRTGIENTCSNQCCRFSRKTA